MDQLKTRSVLRADLPDMRQPAATIRRMNA